MSYSGRKMLSSKRASRKRVTWTIEPDADVKSLVAKEINRRVGQKGDKRGQLTKIINEAVSAFLADLRGKREEAS